MELDKMVGDAHEFKTDVLSDVQAKDRVIAHYDIYLDKKTGYLFLMPKDQKSYIPTLMHKSG
ncbi:hypothetical protein [Streptomyces fructofermentans]|uniref:hypothetical protein n=1 Tax=Streptomyces fructofermentans TaxID=152141 RepID=UPI00378BCA54